MEDLELQNKTLQENYEAKIEKMLKDIEEREKVAQFMSNEVNELLTQALENEKRSSLKQKDTEQVERLKMRINELEFLLEDSETIQQLGIENKALQKVLKELKSSQKDTILAKEMNEKLEKQMGPMQKELDELRHELDLAVTKVFERETERADYEDQIDRLKNERNKFKVKIQELTLETTKNIGSSTLAIGDELQRRIDDINQFYDEFFKQLSTENANLESKLKLLKKEKEYAHYRTLSRSVQTCTKNKNLNKLVFF
jgi:hypothetical protein